MSIATDHSTPEATKRIAYNRESRDYDCFVTIDGGEEQYISSASTYSQGEAKCNSFVYDYYTDTHTYEKAAALVLGDVDVPTAAQLGRRLANARALIELPAAFRHGQPVAAAAVLEVA